MNMRTASLMGKIVGQDYFKAPASEVFEAATVGGARSLGRDDLGRLQEGSLADIVIIDFQGRNSLRYGPVRDPIKSLVECGVGDDVDTVIVDGKAASASQRKSEERRGAAQSGRDGAALLPEVAADSIFQNFESSERAGARHLPPVIRCVDNLTQFLPAF